MDGREISPVPDAGMRDRRRLRGGSDEPVVHDAATRSELPTRSQSAFCVPRRVTPTKIARMEPATFSGGMRYRRGHQSAGRGSQRCSRCLDTLQRWKVVGGSVDGRPTGVQRAGVVIALVQEK